MRSYRKPKRAVSDTLSDALNASGFVGTWETDLEKNLVHFSGPLIALLGIEPERAARGVPLATFLEGIYQDDQDRVAELVHTAHETAGRFEAEFRTVRVDGSIRWVSARGQVETDDRGKGVRCLGMVVDVTNTRAARCPDDELLNVVVNLVDALLALREPITRLGTPTLKTLMDMLLFELGNELKKYRDKSDITRMH